MKAELLSAEDTLATKRFLLGFVLFLLIASVAFGVWSGMLMALSGYQFWVALLLLVGLPSVLYSNARTADSVELDDKSLHVRYGRKSYSIPLQDVVQVSSAKTSNGRSSRYLELRLRTGGSVLFRPNPRIRSVRNGVYDLVGDLRELSNKARELYG